MKRFVEEGYDTAQRVIRENIDDLHALAKALIEYETLTGEEIIDLINGKQPVRISDDDVDTPKGTGVPSAGKAKRKKKQDPDKGAEGSQGMEPQPEG